MKILQEECNAKVVKTPITSSHPECVGCIAYEESVSK
jgi:hypothetical protein